MIVTEILGNVHDDAGATLVGELKDGKVSEYEIPDPCAVTLHRTCDSVSARTVEPNVFCLPLNRIRNIQATLKLFYGTLRIEFQVPAYQLPGDPKALVTNTNAPCPAQCFAQQVTKLPIGYVNIVIVRCAFHSGLNFNGMA